MLNGTWMRKALVFTTAFSFLTVSVAVSAQEQGNRPIISFKTDPDALIVSYSETPQMLGHADKTPRIRVYGDGRVLVHYPEYMQMAGEYETYLNPGELNQLLLAMSGVFEMDTSKAKAARDSLKNQRELQAGSAYYRSEDTLEEMEFLIDSYQPGPASNPRPINRKLAWQNIADDAAQFPELEDMQKLKGARNSVRALLERDDLVKIVTSKNISSSAQ